MPEVAHALIRTLSDDEADILTVTRIIEKDPGLTATLLRMANSAIFGLSRTVRTLDSAVSVVGMSQIRARALSVCMANAFVFPPNLDRLEFWRSSMVCAGYTRWLATHIAQDEQQAWLTGMMLRLGELVIVNHMPEVIASIEALPCSTIQRWEREREHAGFDEGQLSAEIARRWDFPDAVTLALASSAQPLSGKVSVLAGIVHLGAILAGSQSAPAQALGELPVLVVQALALDQDRLLATLPRTESFSDISMLQA